MILRPYQQASIDATFNYLRDREGNPCNVLPVGSGKSVIMAGLARKVIEEYSGTRICILAHVRELVSQNHDKLIRAWPEASAGIYSASLKRRDRFERIIFASIQSVWNRAGQLGRFDLLLVDEAHRIPLKSEGTYRKFIDECARFNPHLRVIGFTATPYRLGGGPVCDPDYILNEVCYEEPIARLIDDGYLSPLVSKGGVTRADLSDVHIRQGEYVEGELQTAMMRGDLVERACKEILELCHDRKAWIIFASSVAHAQKIQATLEAFSITGGVVCGNTPSGERADNIAALRTGRFRFLVTVDVLAEGYDEPRIDAVIMLRPTKSAGKYVQEVGRGTRVIDPAITQLATADERRAAIALSTKPNCLVLDFAGNIAEHGPVDAIRVEKPKRRGDKATVHKQPVKECPQCHSFVAIQVMTCECGHEWPRPEARHDDHATDAPILSGGAVKIAEHVVQGIGYAKHIKPGKPPSLRVTYACGLREFNEWIHLEHGGEPRARAVSWWQARNYTRVPVVPRTVDDALDVAHQLRAPKAITVNESGRYPQIVGVTL